MTTTNGRERKTLASQLDRLDSILDGLADALNGAVASAVEGAVERAVKQAVGEAVRETLQAVIAEVVSNPDLVAAARTLLAPGTPADVPPDPPERPRGLFRRAGEKVQAGVAVAANACAAVAGRVAGVKTAVRAGWGLTAASVVGFCGTLALKARNALRGLFAPAPAFA
jgi:hypothetical protein